MATTRIEIAQPPERVFEVLTDAYNYPHWVVGTRRTLGVDGPFPKPGASFRYDAGYGPLRMRDRTVAVAADPPHRLELLAKARPLPDVSITLEVEPAPKGSVVTLHERPSNRIVDVALGPLGHVALDLRNRIALTRLKSLVENLG